MVSEEYWAKKAFGASQVGSPKFVLEVHRLRDPVLFVQ